MATARATRRSSPAARTKRPPAASSRGGSRLLPELAAIACLALAVFLLFVFLLGWEGGIVGVGLRGLLSFLVGLIAARLGFGLTLFRATSTSQEDPTFLPVIVLSACPHQAGRQPITYRFGQSLSVDLARQA